MAYETNKSIQTLSEIKKAKNKELHLKKESNGKKVLLIALTYYAENYPRSEKNKKWTQVKVKYHVGQQSTDDFLETLSEEDLQNLFEVFDYYSAEKGFHVVKDYESKLYVLAKIKKIIPGGAYIERMRELDKKITENNEELAEYKKKLTQDRRDFRKRLAEKMEEMEEVERKKLPQLEEFKCEICGKVCGNAGGLAVHLKTHGTVDDGQE